MVEIVEDLKRLHLLDLDFTRAGADAANLLERIVGRNLRVGAGGGRSSGGAGRSSFCFRVLRKCGRSKKTCGHEAARLQHPDFSHPILRWSVLSAIEFFAVRPVYRVGVRHGNKGYAPMSGPSLSSATSDRLWRTPRPSAALAHCRSGSQF